MVGTGAIIIPWGFSNSGILLGVFLNLVVFLVCFYTCFLIIRTAGNDTDYTETLHKQFGRKGWISGMALIIAQLMIPIILYFQLLAQNLYPILMAIIG